MLVTASPGGVSHHVNQSKGPVYWRHISNNFLRMPNKIRGLSSEESNSSWPFRGPRLSESELVITSPEGRGKSKGASLDREAREWRDGSESHAAVEGKGGTHPPGQGCAAEAALEETSFWKPQGNYGRLCSATHKMTSRMTSCGGHWEMSSTACSSHKLRDAKPRSQSISRPFQAFPPLKQRREAPPGFIPVLMHLEHKRDTDFSQWLLLPEEIWICIFSLLSHNELARVAPACRHFHRLASDESLEKQVQITDCCVLEDDWLGALACRQPRSLTLHSCLHASRGCDGPGPETIFPALRGCSSVSTK
ncbi:uncharacterized protein LOC117199234 [Orcinus orca]|uniref:uncharacterized protein LOC117199234 n=1 Tax=Orcinus orca TaxID=9733 RepID=UPI0021125D9D|nr:uncharacterized protein LOC117199234 [Orcinus orca]